MTEPQANRFHRSSLSITDNELWCFWFVTLFNLQGTRPRSLGAEALLSYHIQPALSSTFFKFFSRPFSFTGQVPIFGLFTRFQCPLSRALRYDTTGFSFCQQVFSSFLKFLFDLWSQALSRFSSPCTRASSLCYTICTASLARFAALRFGGDW